MRQNLKREAVAAGVGAYVDCKCSIEVKARTLLLASLGQVAKGDQRGVDFTAGLLALGAQSARDMIYDAWLTSANAPVGYPMVNVRDIEGGKAQATRELMGPD